MDIGELTQKIDTGKDKARSLALQEYGQWPEHNPKAYQAWVKEHEQQGIPILPLGNLKPGKEPETKDKEPEGTKFYSKQMNSILELLAKKPFYSDQARITFVILRKTIGWGKETDWISYNQFEEMTGIDRRHLGRAIKGLEERGAIVINRTKQWKPQYSISTLPNMAIYEC